MDQPLDRTPKETSPQHTHLSPRQPSCIVGIGASAGGLEALERFFHAVPPDTGMAFVVVQHLSPDFVSVMDELLVRQTDLPIHTVQDGMSVEANAIYLIPPKKEMIVSGGKLLLTDKDPKQRLALPIDIFFRSLAQDMGPRAIGVILSGTGSDGSRGIRDIHDAGGLVIAQSEETAKFDGMPKSAVETGVVDLVLGPEEMAASLVKYAAHPIPRDLVAESQAPPVDEKSMKKLLRLLRAAYGIDFSLYKQSTVVRRIERRLLLNHSADFDEYVAQVAADVSELDSLYRDLLIGVTQFFRDQEAFSVLEQQVIPELLVRLPDEEEIRMWVAGCATGEEAYSLAILVHEYLTRAGRAPKVKIFATDVHQASLDVANSGVYSEACLTDVSPERLRRYFTRKGSCYQVATELRQMIVFAPHNIIKDAPFTRLDLVSCRNLLIYLQPVAQKKAISLFHFGLKTGGVLMLGPSEGVGELEDEFATIDRHWKVYRKRRDVRLLADMRLPVAGVAPALARMPFAGFGSGPDNDLLSAYDQLLASFLPPAVLIDSRRQVVHVFGKGADYLRFRPGRAPNDVLELFDAGLRTAVSAAIQRASKERVPVAYSGVRVETAHGPRQLKLGVRPLLNRNSELTHMLVSLEDVSPPAAASAPSEPIDIGEVSSQRIESLESELRHSKENLQATIEELETSNEELHATNEELVASNEELQSTNEELHSVNEELYTVNAEYQRKIAELTELTDDMENLLACTQVGVLFLDSELCIRKFTPAIACSFNIVGQDIGRPFGNFTHNIEHPRLIDDVQSVLATGRPVEQQVRDRFGHWYLLRVLPYNTGTRSARSTAADADEFELAGESPEPASPPAKTEGVVVTLIDVDSLKRAQDDLRAKDRQLRGILDNSPAFIFIKDLQGRYLMANGQSQSVLRAAPETVVGKTDYDFLPQPVADRLEAQDRSVATAGETVEITEAIGRGGARRVYMSTKYALRDEGGRICAIAGICSDITRQKRAERNARRAVAYRDRFLAMLSHELRNPLAAVQSATQLLERIQADEGTTRKVADVIRRQSSQMGRLLDDLLDISRMTQGKIELRKEVLDLRRTAEDAILAVRSKVAARGLKLSVDLPTAPLFLRGDAARLQQIQVNLLVNAAKYTPIGGSVFFSVIREDDKAVIRVRDTGVGMSKEFQTRVFELFVQADETLHRAEGGMGVGLTLVQSLVGLHGGSVRAFSPGIGHGSEFTVELPLSPDPVPPEQSAPREPSGVSPVSDDSRAMPGLKLLIVEDNGDAREMLKLLLETYGYEVTTAADGLAALTAIEMERPDVAFIDIGLPEMNGYDVVRRIRKTNVAKDVYLVALTGYGQPADRKRSREAGFDDHLTKPVNIDELFMVLERHAADREVSS